jgi:hypothetical protein
MVVHICIPSFMRCRGRRIMVHGQPRQNKLRAKRDRGIAQVVEYLLSKLESLAQTLVQNKKNKYCMIFFI